MESGLSLFESTSSSELNRYNMKERRKDLTRRGGGEGAERVMEKEMKRETDM